MAFEGIQMLFRAFELSGMCKTLTGVAFEEESHPPKCTFYSIKRGNDDFRNHFQMACDIYYDLLEFYLPCFLRTLFF